MHDIITTDLFQVAYFLNNEIKPVGLLTEVRKEDNRKKIIFSFPRTKIAEEYVEKFKYGEAVSNVVQLKKNFQYARDLMFDRLRNI